MRKMLRCCRGRECLFLQKRTPSPPRAFRFLSHSGVEVEVMYGDIAYTCSSNVQPTMEGICDGVTRRRKRGWTTKLTISDGSSRLGTMIVRPSLLGSSPNSSVNESLSRSSSFCDTKYPRAFSILLTVLRMRNSFVFLSDDMIGYFSLLLSAQFFFSVVFFALAQVRRKKVFRAVPNAQTTVSDCPVRHHLFARSSACSIP